MERNEALQFIDNRLRGGVSKKVIYKELLGLVPDKEDLLSYIGMFPDFSERGKYKKVNLLLFWLLIISAVLQIIYIYLLLTSSLKSETLGRFIAWFIIYGGVLPFLMIFFAVEVWRFRGYIYRLFAILGIVYLIMQTDAYTDLITWSTFNMPFVIAICLSFYIGIKAFPYHSFLKGLNKGQLERDLTDETVKS